MPFFADRFLEGEGKEADARRNKKFKLIPNIPQGSWIIRQSVGTTPVLLGQKLTTKYFKGPNYFEVCFCLPWGSLGGGGSWLAVVDF